MHSTRYEMRLDSVTFYRRYNQALAKMGKETGVLTVDDLTRLGHLDQVGCYHSIEENHVILQLRLIQFQIRQYHYLGTEACDEAITLLGLNDTKFNLLDIGSGIGGPIRYMASRQIQQICEPQN